MDEWGCFPHERQRLFDVILATKANRVILLSGMFTLRKSPELQFGLVEIDWAAKPSAQITLKAITADGSAGFTHRVSLDALR
jgi:hypothetical protein